MSGIAGIYFLDGRAVARGELGSMVEILAHRGPDGSASWSEGNVGLGHRMLWTTPESLHEKLPLQNQTEDLVLTADARIDNRGELASALRLIGRPLQEISDSEMILRAYEKWGEDCPGRLLGDFAFAVWDRRKQAIFCARDGMGVKPFYYYKSNRVFLFASEIKALFKVPEVPRKLNEVMVANYLTSTMDDTSVTFYQGILRLPPGHSLTVSPEKTSLRCYWSLDPSRELQLPSDEAYAEALREIFAEAVRCRLRSAFPVGSQLSGGLDSSSVACMARTILLQSGKRRLHTFSAVFDEVPESDERQYINAALAQGGFEPHYVPADRLNPLGDTDRVFWHLDEPFWAPSMFMFLALFKAAQESGVRILLDGDDGDNAIGYGVGHITRLAVAGRWIAAFREVAHLADHFGRSRWRIFKSYVILPFLPEAVLRFRQSLRERLGAPPAEVINSKFARRVGLLRNHQAWRLWMAAAKRGILDQWRNLTDGVGPYGCEMFNKAAAAFSIELRYPFYDRRLLEFCLAVPASQKLHHGLIRMIMRRAMKGILPEAIRGRGGKTSLRPNFDRALLMFGRETLVDVILKAPGDFGRYVDLADLRKAYHQFSSGQERCDSHVIWSAVVLEQWLRYARIMRLQG
ncbi:MAG: lasso peptide isopeptide bond-forming cyclase [Terriglobia bacterium]|jgi:asparagine synthase (glutamine-hydrolysing)